MRQFSRYCESILAPSMDESCRRNIELIDQLAGVILGIAAETA
jgi:hypothetical protein